MAGTNSISRRYLMLQLSGWGLICLLFGSFSLFYLQSTHHVLTRKLLGHIAISYLLYLVYGVAVSHLLHLALRRWMKLPVSALISRALPAYLGGILLMTVCLIGINGYALDLTMDKGKIDRAVILSAVINNAVLLFGWLVTYALIYTARERRREEALRLATELAAQEAQYRSLSARVNPHFLFNSLNTIRALMYEDIAQADIALTHLASLLRAGLRGEERREIPLKDELEVVNDYLRLEQMRFEQRLRVYCHIEPSAERALVPPMTVQHLVENAVKHGIARIEEGGEIAIHAQAVGHTLEITVTNPVPLHTPSSPENTNTGIQNTRQRLRMLYGSLALLDLNLQPAMATATLRLPLNPQEMQEN